MAPPLNPFPIRKKTKHLSPLGSPYLLTQELERSRGADISDIRVLGMYKPSFAGINTRSSIAVTKEILQIAAAQVIALSILELTH